MNLDWGNHYNRNNSLTNQFFPKNSLPSFSNVAVSVG